MSEQRIESRPEGGSFGVLETLSPEMAKDLGDAFSLASIANRSMNQPHRDTGETTPGAVRFAGSVVLCLLVAVVAVSVTVTALYLIPLP